MEDSKLLEFAGRAAGETYNQENNPLERDDLALRLAVKLGISVSYDRLDQGVDERRVFAVHARGVELEHLGTDPYAATRRAIVRAAAEIGRGMV